MSSHSVKFVVLVGLIISMATAGCVAATVVPVRGDFPPGAGLRQAVPICGGIPLPRGQLTSSDNVALFSADGRELPCQVTATAWWPDGSIKWVLVDVVLPPAEAGGLLLKYGQGVTRAKVADPITAAVAGSGGAKIVKISGGGVQAAISRSGGVMDSCTIAGKTIVSKGSAARLVVKAIRIAAGTSGKALPIDTFLCRDPKATPAVGRVVIDKLTVTSPGPIRVTVLARGRVLLPKLGSTLPEVVTKTEPAGSLPFSMRLSFYRNCPVIFGQHQIIYTGEPDCDYITRWGIELPGQASGRGKLILEPGAELDLAGGKQSVSPRQNRLCWAPLKAGFALIRKGWANRPCAITQQNGSAWVEFWPAAAGVWDLRRYSREWAVGENGDTTKPDLMLNYAKYAARGMAKSQDFVIYAGDEDLSGAGPGIVRALSGNSLLVAKPGWYAASEALGPIAPEQRSGPLAKLDATSRRRTDYYLYCQDLFNWYGKLEYGFWQTRFGSIHRNDRWDRDYGRWGWSLNDGAGRIGHALMIEYLRTGDRRYFTGGQAFNRINYDTSMVHTEKHLEVAYHWWKARGNTHRHNVMPFGDPYIGMRGSYPLGQRLLYLLTGDGVIADGLDIVAATSLKAAEGQPNLLGHSAGPDGQGSASNALLWKYETTGDKRYLRACRSILDASGLIPPAPGRSLGYAPSFGLFSAAGEYADLTGDKDFIKRIIATGKMGARQKSPARFLYAIAMAVRFSRDKDLRAKLVEILTGLANRKGDSLAELPVDRWPGHAGFRIAKFEANLMRDYTCAMAVIDKPSAAGPWPKHIPAAKAVPASPPSAWFTPGGVQTPAEDVPSAATILALRPVSASPAAGEKLTAGDASLTCFKSLCDSVDVKGASPLAGGIVPYVQLVSPRAGSESVAARFRTFRGKIDSIGPSDGGLVVTGMAGPVHFTATLRSATADGVASIRVEMACKVPAGRVDAGRGDVGRVASWGLLIPLKMGDDPHAIQTTGPGRFRLERCRLDQNDERIPNWLTSEYHWPDGTSLWPKWRESGIDLGPGRYYRIWRGNRVDTSVLDCDRGRGGASWFDVTDRGVKPRWGLTVRVIRRQPIASTVGRQSIRIDLASGLMQVQFHSASAQPLPAAAGVAGLAGAADLIFHDGWRPPLAKPELTPSQYARFMDDLDYGGNYGLFALRFRLSITHMVKGRKWADLVRDHGIEPREILYGMLYANGLAKHCRRIGVKWDPNDVEGSVRRVIDHYRQ